MTGEDARLRAKQLLRKYLEITEEEAAFLADKLYADIVATAVDDERNIWVLLSARDPVKDH